MLSKSLFETLLFILWFMEQSLVDLFSKVLAVLDSIQCLIVQNIESVYWQAKCGLSAHRNDFSRTVLSLMLQTTNSWKSFTVLNIVGTRTSSVELYNHSFKHISKLSSNKTAENIVESSARSRLTIW